MSARYIDVVTSLHAAYDGRVDERDRNAKQAWKLEERTALLARLHDEGHQRLLEVGDESRHLVVTTTN